jgi:hypothetical protein
VTVDNIWGEISTFENSYVNTTIVPDSFTTNMPIRDNPMAQKDIHKISFSNSTSLSINQVYNMSVVIHIHLKDPTVAAIEYYPGFQTALMGGKNYVDPVPGFTATVPASLLPKYVHSANGSTNISNQWYYSLQISRGVRLEEIRTIFNSSITSQKIGVVRNGNTWLLDASGNGVYGAGDLAYTFGRAGDVPVTGDWNNDGKSEIGVVRNGNTWLLDASGNGVYGSGDLAYTFGKTGDVPVTGDWNGDGKTEIGVVRNGNMWLLDASGNGAYGGGDLAYIFGKTSDKYVTGKWT